MPYLKCRALNIAVGGSGDSRIHFLKKGETCEAGNEQTKI